MFLLLAYFRSPCPFPLPCPLPFPLVHYHGMGQDRLDTDTKGPERKGAWRQAREGGKEPAPKISCEKRRRTSIPRPEPSCWERPGHEAGTHMIGRDRGRGERGPAAPSGHARPGWQRAPYLSFVRIDDGGTHQCQSVARGGGAGGPGHGCCLAVVVAVAVAMSMATAEQRDLLVIASRRRNSSRTNPPLAPSRSPVPFSIHES